MAGSDFPGALRSLLLALGLSLFPWTASGQEEAAARVNDAEISRSRFERYFGELLKMRGVAEADPAAYAGLRREALDRLIDRELLVQEAARRGIAGSAAEMAEARRRLAAAFDSDEARRRSLAEAGFSEAAFEDYLRREITARKVLRELIGATEPDETEVTGLYRERHGQPAGLGADPAALDSLRQELAARRRAEAEGRVLQELRRKARVEVLLPL